jgi:ATP-dependent RNA helicase HelY
MTTEVLRNMIYAGSHTLSGLGYVVMDEVHYLADRMRGAVWEEVIIHLPDSVSLIALSATVSNVEEFGEWLGTVRGETRTILEETRPVPLFQHMLVGRRMYDLFARDSDQRLNPELVRVARDDWASRQMRDRRSPKGSNRGRGRQVGNGRRVWIPSRAEVAIQLDRDGLLPAIVFIFSRLGCDAAVQQCLNANIRLTTPQERDEIYAFVEEHCAHIPSADLEVLGYDQFLDGLTRGVAAHHAGLLPTFKECVEELFSRSLCKLVFATETLALGINMPARSVVLEKLSKWNGETHADITPGEYTQLTGRAGRRGIDVEGHAVVLWQPGVDPRSVSGLASTRTYPLKSSFRPSYNMAVNLVHQVGRERARELLEASFAQFQADKAVVGLARQLHKSDEALEGYAEAATCDRGDFMEYAGLRRKLSDVEGQLARSRRGERRQAIIDSLDALRPGDVIDVPSGRFAGIAVVIDPSSRGNEGPRPYVLTLERQARRLGMPDFNRPVVALTRIRIPKTFNGRNPQSRRDLASTLRQRADGLAERAEANRPQREAGDAVEDSRIADLRARLRAHPCHDCPDREDHARWAERWFKLDRDAATLRRRIEQRTNTIARHFDRICEVLTALDYLVGDEITPRGQVLMRIYNELDLLAAECLRQGIWSDLSPSELAAVLSVLVYESRRADDEEAPRVPGGRVRTTLGEVVRIWGELEQLEKDFRLDQLREPDLGFCWAAYRWAEGESLDQVLDTAGSSAGDFVRQMKQLIDFTSQIADAADNGDLRRTARKAVEAMRRGVVDYASEAP